ncbi:MAG: hypothetical protein H6Q89_5268 [Myxococcaceae bacterium]|nr:hypothetical protein [Myxococcaceae bacterium]
MSSFFARLKLAWAVLLGRAPAEPPPPALLPALTPETAHASGLFLLGMLQREGRLIDFLQEDVGGFSDAEVGAAARVVHQGCRKVLREYLPVVAVVPQSEGDPVTVPAGFDANRYRLSGNVTGQAPYAGSLKHHGWVATEVKLPPVPTTMDVKVLAPAEVELP